MDKCYEKFVPAKSLQVQQGFINNDFELVIIDGTQLYGISTGVFDKKNGHHRRVLTRFLTRKSPNRANFGKNNPGIYYQLIPELFLPLHFTFSKRNLLISEENRRHNPQVR